MLSKFVYSASVLVTENTSYGALKQVNRAEAAGPDD